MIDDLGCVIDPEPCASAPRNKLDARQRQGKHWTAPLIYQGEREVNDVLRSDGALTMALLGILQIDTILLPRLSGKMAKRKTG